MENSINNIKNEIKEKLKNKDTEGAKRFAVKQVKITEQMQRLEGVLAMMEEKKMMLENTTAMKDVMSIIKQGIMAIKESSNYLSVEDLEEMKDKIEDVKADKEELNKFFKDKLDECENEKVACILEELEDEINPNKEKNKQKEKDEDEDDLLNFLAIDDTPLPIKEKEEKK